MIPDERRGLQNSNRVPFESGAEARRRRSLRIVESAVDFPLEEQHGILGRETLDGEAAHLVPQTPVARRHSERRLRSDIEHLLQLVLRQIHVVENDQRLLVAQAAPDLCVGRTADFVAFVEGFENELEEIGERLTARPDVGDAVNERRGPRMMRQVPEDCRLADPWFATQLNR